MLQLSRILLWISAMSKGPEEQHVAIFLSREVGSSVTLSSFVFSGDGKISASRLHPPVLLVEPWVKSSMLQPYVKVDRRSVSSTMLSFSAFLSQNVTPVTLSLHCCAGPKS